MSTQNTSKINRLLQTVPPGTVLSSSWMTSQGYSPDLQKRYRASRWLDPVGVGAMKRTGDPITLEGAVFTLQQQLQLPVHIGGRSALALQGKMQYLPFGNERTYLFAPLKTVLPKWFREYPLWKDRYELVNSDFLPAAVGLTDFDRDSFRVKIATPARAIMECLYLVPKEQSLMECYEIMEGLNNLRPALVQQLLAACTSVKVKRLFLLLAEKAGHLWFRYLKTEEIDLGKGKRSLARGGVYNPQYQITVPKELLANE